MPGIWATIVFDHGNVVKLAFCGSESASIQLTTPVVPGGPRISYTAVLAAYGGVASRGSGLGRPGPGKTPLSRTTATPPMINATATTSGTHARLRSVNTVPPDQECPTG